MSYLSINENYIKKIITYSTDDQKETFSNYIKYFSKKSLNEIIKTWLELLHNQNIYFDDLQKKIFYNIFNNLSFNEFYNFEKIKDLTKQIKYWNSHNRCNYSVHTLVKEINSFIIFNSNNLFYFYGSGGIGKTYLVSKFIDQKNFLVLFCEIIDNYNFNELEILSKKIDFLVIDALNEISNENQKNKILKIISIFLIKNKKIILTGRNTLDLSFIQENFKDTKKWIETIYRRIDTKKYINELIKNDEFYEKHYSIINFISEVYSNNYRIFFIFLNSFINMKKNEKNKFFNKLEKVSTNSIIDLINHVVERIIKTSFSSIPEGKKIWEFIKENIINLINKDLNQLKDTSEIKDLIKLDFIAYDNSFLEFRDPLLFIPLYIRNELKDTNITWSTEEVYKNANSKFKLHNLKNRHWYISLSVFEIWFRKNSKNIKNNKLNIINFQELFKISSWKVSNQFFNFLFASFSNVPNKIHEFNLINLKKNNNLNFIQFNKYIYSNTLIFVNKNPIHNSKYVKKWFVVNNNKNNYLDLVNNLHFIPKTCFEFINNEKFVIKLLMSTSVPIDNFRRIYCSLILSLMAQNILNENKIMIALNKLTISNSLSFYILFSSLCMIFYIYKLNFIPNLNLLELTKKSPLFLKFRKTFTFIFCVLGYRNINFDIFGSNQSHKDITSGNYPYKIKVKSILTYDIFTYLRYDISKSFSYDSNDIIYNLLYAINNKNFKYKNKDFNTLIPSEKEKWTFENYTDKNSYNDWEEKNINSWELIKFIDELTSQCITNHYFKKDNKNITMPIGFADRNNTLIMIPKKSFFSSKRIVEKNWKDDGSFVDYPEFKHFAVSKIIEFSEKNMIFFKKDFNNSTLFSKKISCVLVTKFNLSNEWTKLPNHIFEDESIILHDESEIHFQEEKNLAFQSLDPIHSFPNSSINEKYEHEMDNWIYKEVIFGNDIKSIYYSKTYTEVTSNTKPNLFIMYMDTHRSNGNRRFRIWVIFNVAEKCLFISEDYDLTDNRAENSRELFFNNRKYLRIHRDKYTISFNDFFKIE